MNTETLMTATENVCNFVFHWCGVWLVMNSATMLGMKLRGLRLVAVKASTHDMEEDEARDEVPAKKQRTFPIATVAAIFQRMADTYKQRAAEIAEETDSQGERREDIMNLLDEEMPEDEAEPGGADELSDQQEGEDGHAD